MKNEKYNGWTNYATWRVNLEIFDGLYSDMEGEKTTGTNAKTKHKQRNTMKTTERIEVRKCQIENKNHPEWGAFGVMEDCGDWYEILGDSGHRILFKTEADRFWRVV